MCIRDSFKRSVSGSRRELQGTQWRCDGRTAGAGFAYRCLCPAWCCCSCLLYTSACEEYGAKFFANGAAPGGVLEHRGTLKDPQRIRESWQSTYGGTSNAHRSAVLEEGMKYTPIGISPEQAQFLETRKFQDVYKRQILTRRLFGDAAFRNGRAAA